MIFLQYNQSQISKPEQISHYKNLIFPFSLNLKKHILIGIYFPSHFQNIFPITLIFDIQKMKKKVTQTQQSTLETGQQKKSKPHSNKIYQFFVEGKVAIANKEATNNVSLIINIICQFVYLSHVLVAQQLISQEQLAPFIQSVIQAAISGVFVYKLLQVFSIILKLLIIQSIYLDLSNSEEIIGFSWLKRIILKSFFTFKEVDTLLSSYLLFVSWSQNLFLFAFSLLIEGVYAIYFQNYVIRKDLFYITSSFQNIFLRISFAILIASNIILVKIGSQLIFTIYHIFFMIVMYIWYFKWGKRIHKHAIMNRTFLAMVTTYGAFVFSLTEKLFTGFNVIDVNSISKLILSFIVLTTFFMLGQRKSSNYVNRIYDTNIKDYDLFISKLAQKSIDYEDSAALLFGKIYLDCLEGKFLQSNQEIFDPLLKTSIQMSQRKLTSQRDSSYRFYCKLYYEKLITRDPSNKKKLVDYCEFLYNQIKNVYLLIQAVEKAEEMDLNIIERIKVSKIKFMIKEQNLRLNSELYDGKLQLENIIQSQQCFSEIQRNIVDYLDANLQIMGFLFQPEIQLSQIHCKLVQSFTLVEQTTKLWAKLSKYFNVHKEWKFSYLKYLLFIKNENIKLRQFDDSKGDHNGDFSTFNSHKIFLEEVNSSTEELFNESILFNEGSFCFKTQFENNQLVIHEVSRLFEKHTMYSADEIKGTLLDDLICADMRQSHATAVQKWITEGYLIDDTAYKARFTKCLKKNGYAFPVIKYYKSHVDIQKGLEFICLLKQNTKPSIIEECEQNRQKSISGPIVVKKTQNEQLMPIQRLNEQFTPLVEHKNFHSESNIFIKEEILQPPKHYNIGLNFKRSSRIFTFSIFVSIIILLLINQDTSSNLVSYGNQFITFMNVHRYVNALGTAYLKYTLNIGSAKAAAKQIETFSLLMQTQASSSNTKKTLFDPTLVVPATYSPYYNYSWMNNQTYNQIDLLYLIYSSTTTLSKLPFNRTGKQFQNFNSFIHPAYNNMMNGTKFRLQARFQTLFTAMINTQLWFMLTQGLLFVIFVIISFYYVYKSITKMKRFFLILLDFTIRDLQKITDYWVKLSVSFDCIFSQMHKQEGPARNRSNKRKSNLTDKFVVQQRKRSNMSSSKPTIIQGKARRNYQCLLLFLIVMTTAITLILVLILEFNIIVSIKKEQKFQVDGFFFLKYFPPGPLGYSVMEKYYSLLYPSQITFNPNRYANVLSSMYLFGKINYLGQMDNPSSLYYKKQKNYFFGNLCAQNPTLLASLNITQSNCQTISNGTFKQGGSAFIRYSTQIADDYINNRITLSPAQLQNFTLSIIINSNFAFDAVTTWLSQFSDNVNADFTNYLAVSIIVLVIIVILHIIFNEVIIAHKIQEDYKCICRAYDNLVPEYILINEKVIRQKFVIEGLISE